MVTMTDTPAPPRPTHPMRYVFPAEITDLETANGLPTETLIRALNMCWLVDGRATCWPAGSGSGMTLADLLEHGPLIVEWLPPIEEAERIRVIDLHLSNAVHRRRHLPDNVVPMLQIPSIVAENRQPRARAHYRIGVVTKLAQKIPVLRDTVGETLSTWLGDRLAELDLTVEQAEEMTAHQFPMTRESLAAEKDPNPPPSPDDSCAACRHPREEHQTHDGSCSGIDHSYYGTDSPCECEAFAESTEAARG